MNSYSKVWLIALVLLITGCSDGYLSRDELNAYVLQEENGLVKQLEVNGVLVRIQYRPTDLWVYQELANEPIERSRVEQLRKKYHKNYYFILSLSKNNKEALHQTEGLNEYSDLVQNLAFRMDQYSFLTTNKFDTIPVSDFVMNRTFGMSNSTDILLVFNKKETKRSEWVQFNLNECGLNVGNHRFRFSTVDLESAPKLFK